MSNAKVNCGNIEISNDNKICIIAGPCQLETEQHAMDMAGKIQEITNNNHIFVIHREIKSENKLKDHINIIDKRIYGRSEIFFGRLF